MLPGNNKTFVINKWYVTESNQNPMDFIEFRANPEQVLTEDKAEHTDPLEQILEEDEAAMMFSSTWNFNQTPSRTIAPSIGQKEELYIEEAIRSIDADNLKLLVNSPGGSVSSSYNIADMIDRGFENVEAYVPGKAKSGGTLICLAADQIVLGFNGELGPLDPQYRDSDGDMRSVNQGLRKFEELDQKFSTTQDQDIPYTKRKLAQDFTPEELQRWEDLHSHMNNKTLEIISGNDSIPNEDAKDITDTLTGKHRAHSDPIKYHHLTEGDEYDVLPSELDYDALPDEVIFCEQDKPQEMEVMREWYRSYLTAKTSDHIVRVYE